MSFLFPKKPQILYAPMLASFGGGSARGFNPGGGGGLFDFSSLTFLATPGTTYHSTNQTFIAGARVFEESNTISDYLANYDTSTNPWLSDTNFYSLVRAGFQKFTIPADGDYRFTVAGTAGADSSGQIQGNNQGRGAIMRAEFALTEGDYVQIVVAKQTDWQGSGGGASFVSDSSNNPLIVAGGGGSIWSNSGAQPTSQAPNSTIGNASGSNSNQAQDGNGGYQSSAGYGAGAGWYTDNSSSLSNNRQSVRLYDDARGGGYKDPTGETYQGAFGGAGGAISGGAGYSGGTGGSSPYLQGGGGSFISSTCTGNNVGTITGSALTVSGSEPDSVYASGGTTMGRNNVDYGYVTVQLVV